MGTNNIVRSDLNRIYNISQNIAIVYPKEVIIATLRDFFSKDTFYHYSKDQWGFANTTDHTDLPLGSDVPSDVNQSILPTRLFIGENYRYNGIFYPAILVKSNGVKYVPLSINREQGSVKCEDILYDDGYGNKKIIKRPISFVTAGIWEGSITIDVLSRSLRARDDLVELIGICFSDIVVNQLYDVGLIIKPPNINSPSEIDDRADKLFKQSITIDIRTEWYREIPVSNIIEAILFTIQFQDLSDNNSSPVDGLTINTEVNLTDLLLNI